MAWLGALCRVLAAYGCACGEHKNKAGLARWLGRGSKAHTVAWAQELCG